MTKIIAFDEYRRQYLMGECLLARAADDEQFAAKALAGLEEFLVDDHDRALFGLPPKRATAR